MVAMFLLKKKRERDREKEGREQTTFNSVQDYGMIHYVQLYEKNEFYMLKNIISNRMLH